MSDEALTKVLSGLRGRRFRGRSDLYRWLRANYKRLASRLEQDQVAWGILAQEIGAAGIKNRKGAPPSADSVRRIWATVSRDVALAAAVAARRRKYPSGISPDWRPQLVSGTFPGPAPASSSTTPAAVPVAASGAPSSAASPEAPMEFSTLDADGNPVPAGKVFYEGKVMSRYAAE